MGGGAPSADYPPRNPPDYVADESLLLARVAACFVSPDRVAAADRALAAGATVLVLDDGLQNPSLVKDVSLAMIDGAYGFGNGLCLPAGPMRAPARAQWPYVSVAVIVDAPGPVAKGWRDAAGGKATGARLVPDPVVVERLLGREVCAFAGIGRPEKFFATLSALGAKIAVTRGFPDHHRYGRDDLDALFAEAEKRGIPIVTTEKDFVRLPQSRAKQADVLPVSLRFDDESIVERLLDEALARRRGRGD
jgi:tetraacyldisaccharide 4'-kinase